MAAEESIFCSSFQIWGLERCMLMSEWGVHWSAAGVCATVIAGAVAGFKIWVELSGLRKQKARDAQIREEDLALRRTEFFIGQHRRLFDDPDLYEVICHLDGDVDKLATREMSDKNRKFLTFIEEIALLVNSNNIRKEVAYYMFGYFASLARSSKEFNTDIDTSAMHWRIFQDFEQSARAYLDGHPEGPDDLRL